MAYKALYRKYRPKTFSDVYGQDHITETLKAELAAGKVSHAYLFTGTRGTGKTSCAKILAHAVNCSSAINGDPCLECEACKLIGSEAATDVVEIDAASNNGVDDIRLLREQISFSPTALKYRVFIIDEVHMLSIPAFNALLKTIEEPPAHVVFILATTEVHKIPATILSRCQRFDFRRIAPEKIADRIHYIAKEEGFTVTDDAASLIAAAADGGMRDALSILDLCISVSKEVTADLVTEVCGMSGTEHLNRLSDAILKGDCEEALTLVDTLHKNSVDMQRLANELSAHFRDIMVCKAVKGDKKPVVASKAQLEILMKKAENADIKDIMRALKMLTESITAMQTGSRRSVFEMTVIKLCNPALSHDLDSLEKRIRLLESGAVRTAPIKAEEKIEERKEEKAEIKAAAKEEKPPVEKKAEPIKETPSAPVSAEENSSAEEPVKAWQEIIKTLKTTCPLIAGVLDGSQAFIQGAYLLIDAPNPQFRDLINNKNSIYRDAVRKAAEDVLGVTYKLGPYHKQQVSEEDDPLKALAEKLKQLQG